MKAILQIVALGLMNIESRDLPINGVDSFYADLSPNPNGRHSINLLIGTP
jgi:NADH:ubiquinone oxidoreductase subunit E